MSKVNAEKNGKMHQPGRQNGIQNDPKIDVWAIRGPTFEVLGAFLRSLIFNEFSIGKNSAKNLIFWVRGSAKGKLPARVGG